jgi:cation/acetate symporter
MPTWTFGVFPQGISPQGIGAIGMLLNFAITLALAPLFPAPPQYVQDMVDAVREPEGEGPPVALEGLEA